MCAWEYNESLRNSLATYLEDNLYSYQQHLIVDEYSPLTIKKYIRDIKEYISFCSCGPCDFSNSSYKEIELNYKKYLENSALTAVTINSKLSSINSYFNYIGLSHEKVKLLKIQNSAFRDPSKDLNIIEYRALVEVARDHGEEMIALIIETICSTGIRVSELRYVTVEAVISHQATIKLKGKIRKILLPTNLSKKLINYCKTNYITSGMVFVSRNGELINRKEVWRRMKHVAEQAGIESSKVFPHNLRHLFAITYYNEFNDISKLADILGHTSINTTRRYLLTSGTEHLREIDSLGLV